MATDQSYVQDTFITDSTMFLMQTKLKCDTDARPGLADNLDIKEVDENYYDQLHKLQ